MQKAKFILENASFEGFACFLKENLHKVVGSFILMVGCIFIITYLLHEKNVKNQQVIGSYVAGISYFSQNDSVLALRYAQDGYNNSKGMLEVASFVSVVEILFADKQHAQILEIVKDVVTSKQNANNGFLLYSYLFQTVQKLEKNGILRQQTLEVFKEIQAKVEKVNVAKNYAAHKTMLLMEINAITQFYKPNHYLESNNEGSIELQSILKEIGKNYN